ncbi:Pkinase-domain-containing protein [Hesseltinella vesiculosa]|uniref:Pkinase-domain-containing protein n=1 Tax=Hesseltinella vesiculosa TaxID=101127 RepID=A0A1X2G4K7_9FUNG|nr:Pkinase-domain-containing protein [Hesseltinella vesiculosa]
MSRSSSQTSYSSISSADSTMPKTPSTPTNHSQTPHKDPHHQTKTRQKRSTLPRHHSRSAAPDANHPFTKSSGSLGHSSKRRWSNSAKSRHATDQKLLLKSRDAQYQLGNCIGTGQFGSVYRALDLGTGEVVAIKRIKTSKGELEDDINKEIDLLKALSHSNVICYLGFIPSKHHMNIILEYAENGSLKSTLKSFGAFPEKLVCSFSVKILEGLEYLHNNDVVHCDLKAANILTTKTGDVKLSDFGVSLNLKIKPASQETVAGTPNWMAPEVIQLKGASTKSDIWSLGCTLIELVTGKPPYSDLVQMSAMFRIVEDKYPPLPKLITEEMQSFLLCCFQKNPDERPTATQLKNHLWLWKNRKQLRRHRTYSRNLSGCVSPSPSRQSMSSQLEPCSSACSSAHYPCHHATGSLSRCPSNASHSSRRDPPLARTFGLPSDYITHRFVDMSAGKVVECKVCNDMITSKATFCQACGLICHDVCKKLAFSCPPKVMNQQPAYDWVFSAKVYNKQPMGETSASTSIADHPHASSIQKYADALGLTEQEQHALSKNPALLSHAMLLEQNDQPAMLRLFKKQP